MWGGQSLQKWSSLFCCQCDLFGTRTHFCIEAVWWRTTTMGVFEGKPNNWLLKDRGGSRGWLERSHPLKTYESNFVHHAFVQFGKQHSHFKAILPSTVLSQQCCEAYFISLTVEPVMNLDYGAPFEKKLYWTHLTQNFAKSDIFS